MAPRYKITLTQEERGQLKAMTRIGKASAAKFVHARALLLSVTMQKETDIVVY